MLGCHLGRLLQVTVAGGSYQEGLTSVIQGVPPGMYISEQEIYGDLLLRKPGADELSSPRKEPDLPVIYSGLNVADTVQEAGNKNQTNGTPLCILIPNLDRAINTRRGRTTRKLAFLAIKFIPVAFGIIGPNACLVRHEADSVYPVAIVKTIRFKYAFAICKFSA